MSTYSEGLGPEEEDGGGWSGLVPSAEEKRQEKAEKSSSEIWNEAVREPAVETRLTAEQLATEILANHDDNYLGPNPKAAERKIKTLAAKIEAFRDKSEAGLREEIERLQQAHERIGDILLPLVDTPDGTSVGCAENAAKELTELRAKLADLQKAVWAMTPGGSEFANDTERCLDFVRERLRSNIEQVKLRKAAEAEAAALRERERKGLTFRDAGEG